MRTPGVLLRWLAFIALTGAQVLAPVPAQAQALAPTNSIPGGLYEAFLNAAGSEAPSFHQNGNSFSLQTGPLQAQINPAGLSLSALDGSSWNWGIQLDGFGRGTNPAGLAAPTLSSVDASVTYRYAGLSQWLRSTGIGLEQGFTVDHSPQGSGNLVLQMTLNTSLTGSLSKDGRSLTFDVGHGTSLRYDNLRVYDAHQTELGARLVYASNRITIQVDDHAAAYPLTIDPLIFLQTKLISLDGAAFDSFGGAVAISGTTAVIGANNVTVAGHASQGAAYVFVLSGGAWIQQAKLTASDGAAIDHFGYAVAISGNTVLVGAYQAAVGANAIQGAAYVFVRSGTTWALQQKLTASDGSSNDYFGLSTAISDNTLVVGALVGGLSFGKAYVFQRSGTVWTQMARLTASDGGAFDEFGVSVSVSGNTVVVGAPARSGAYVFVMPGGGWTDATENAKLTASDGGANFGNSVAISGDTLVVGASTATVGGHLSQGEAYVFVKPGGGWTSTTENAILTASDGTTSDSLGSSVAISGDTVLAGAYGVYSGQGRAYVFVKSGGGWFSMTESARLSASGGMPGDEFGLSVGLSGDTAVVGAMGVTSGGHIGQGAAYIFEPDHSFDLAVHAAAAQTSVLPGNGLVVTLTVRNYGPATASGVTLKAPIPPGFTYSSSTNATLGSYNHLAGVWSVGALDPDVTATLNLQVTAGTSAAGTTGVFKVTSLNSDTNGANNSASLGVMVSPLVFSPLSLAFGNQLIQTPGAAHTVTARNLSAGTLAIGTLSVSPGFLLSSNTCNGVLLAYNATCSFVLKFKPAAATGYSGKLTLPHNGLGGSSFMSLGGTGVSGTQLLTNTSFETAVLKVPTGWTQAGSWAVADGQDCTTHHLGSCSLEFTGTNLPKSLSFTVMQSGVSGDDFLFSLWNKAAAVPAAAPVDRVRIQVFNGATLVTTKTLSFAKGTHGFTKSMLAFTMTTAYTKLVVMIEYKAASGTAWFDDATLLWAP